MSISLVNPAGTTMIEMADDGLSLELKNLTNGQAAALAVKIEALMATPIGFDDLMRLTGQQIVTIQFDGVMHGADMVHKVDEAGGIPEFLVLIRDVDLQNRILEAVTNHAMPTEDQEKN